jgi:hypothetical protein
MLIWIRTFFCLAPDNITDTIRVSRSGLDLLLSRSHDEQEVEMQYSRY